MATEAQTCAIGILTNRRNPPKSTGPHSQKVLEIPSITLFLFALVALWLKNPFNQRNPRLKKYSSCRVLGPLHLSRTLYKSTLFMQNKANFRKAKMNVNSFITKDYERNDIFAVPENKANSNPIKANLPNAQMNISSVLTKDYENKPRLPAPPKQTQTNPISLLPKSPGLTTLTPFCCRIIFTAIGLKKPKIHLSRMVYLLEKTFLFSKYSRIQWLL